MSSCFFFFNDTATTEIYTLSLHDALPICLPLGARAGAVPGGAVGRGAGGDGGGRRAGRAVGGERRGREGAGDERGDRESTRLKSRHAHISYAVFFFKKKKKYHIHLTYHRH